MEEIGELTFKGIEDGRQAFIGPKIVQVDLITASIWAGTEEVYIKTHPNKTKEDFYKIKESLKMFSELKIRKNRYFPHVKIYNVICNLNYKEIQQMINFALDTQVEFIEFQIMDITEKQTTFLALTSEQIGEIKRQFSDLLKHNDLYFKELGSFNFLKDRELKEFLGRFIKIPNGFLLKEWIEKCRESVALHSLICPKGFTTLPTKTNPLIEENINKITFSFLEVNCQDCPLLKAVCYVNEEYKISFKYLKILGFGSFMRRINSVNIYEQFYEKELIDNLPCYVGWIYSRVLSTGEVIPCCKSVNKPLGNINKDKFSDIWNSEVYKELDIMQNKP